MLTEQKPVMLTPKQFHHELNSRGYSFSFETVRRWFRLGLVHDARKVGGRYFVPIGSVQIFIDSDVY
jgi:hypothetical protein